ncbi:alkaline phosphatase D family protein [Altererythrobacter sp. H2]|uniref:alkaline phosphatase D family protein n=1 Tax=Altererythrobacter sp. H2 TaxID=3108391 RepID=UPI002B4BD4DE|nr:alkaline phosphatase D family protein [Altererythrobacter sp. H2]WRK94484.1 alkaline phosphatase D family protein [Altererythrobacter sp. H2]
MPDRRSLLKAAAALAASRFIGAAAARPAAQPVRLAGDPFALGVASGEPATHGFVLWTRLAGLGADAEVGYEIADDEGFRRIIRTGRALAPVARGGAVHAEIGGLPSGRTFFYRFHFAGAVSRTGRTATIARAPQRLRLALTSCQHWEHGWFTGYRDMIAQGAEAVLQVGDYIYEKSFGAGPDVRAFGTPDPVSLADYRTRHALYRSDPDLAAAHAAMPFIVTFDDHEVENDYAGAGGGVTADPVAFLRRRAAAYQAYFEHMPLRPSALRADGELRLYRRFSWGDLASVHVLDTRQYRSGRPCPAVAERGARVAVDCPEAHAPAETMLGAAQEAWLRRVLASERAGWSLIAQQTFFSRLFLPQGEGALYTDIWDGYAATRQRTLASLAHPAVRNAVLLGGDVHSFWLNDVKRDFADPGTSVVAAEVVTSCLASRNGPAALFETAKALNPHVRFHDNAHAGYVLLAVAPERIEIDLRVVANLADRRSPCFSIGRHAIENGRPGIA